MIIYFQTTFTGDTKKVKSFLKENGFVLASKKIKFYNTIVIDTVNKEYKFDKDFYYGSVSVFWLIESMINGLKMKH